MNFNNRCGTKDGKVTGTWKQSLILKIGQKVTLPRIGGEYTRRRKAVVVEEYKHHYVVETEYGYKESIQKKAMEGVRLA